MKNLPKVFHNTISKEINNNNKIFYGKGNYEKKEENNIRKKLDEYFKYKNKGTVDNIKIILKNETLDTRLIGRNNKFVITKESKLISINDITDIKYK